MMERTDEEGEFRHETRNWMCTDEAHVKERKDLDEDKKIMNKVSH